MKNQPNDIIIFSGLTLNRPEIEKALPLARYLPPATQGDLYKAYQIFKPKIVALIDGFFEVQPSVWHKEILYLLSQGVTVYGSSSMGALRAAELHTFGMIGIGKIFEGYLTGKLEDDDEVAVFHGPVEVGYPALSDAMVSIRATICKAVNSGIIDKATEIKILKTAKKLFYKERTYERIFSEIKMKSSEIKKFMAWLSNAKIDLKRNDAIQLLNILADIEIIPIFEPLFKFNETVFWENSKL